MWLIEKDPEGKTFWPVNLDNICFIESVNQMGTPPKYFIQFNFVQNASSRYVRWNFEEDGACRDKYLEKIHKILPQISLGIDDITL